MMKFLKKIHFLIKMRLPSIFEQHARIFKSNGIKLQLFPSAYRFQDQNIFQLKLDSFLVNIFSLILIGYDVLFS